MKNRGSTISGKEVTIAALALVLASVLLLTMAQEPAGATFPGKNGKIAITGYSDVSTINEDGNGRQDISLPESPDELTYSPDGSKIAVEVYPGHIYVMNADGSGLRRLTTQRYADEESPVFSPDGSKIAFYSEHEDSEVGSSIYVVNTDGSGLKKLVHTAGASWIPLPQAAASRSTPSRLPSPG